MAYTSGTAANYKDLLAIMATFAAANGWVIMEQSSTLAYLKGTGASGLDEIYCGVSTYEDAPNNRYNWQMVGSWGWRSGRAFNAHPKAMGVVGSYLWNAPIPYWMVCNGRRIIVCAKVGTTYQMAHLGLLTVPATDAQYPYPLYIGGSHYLMTQNYSSVANRQFWSNTVGFYHARLNCPGGIIGNQASVGESSNSLFIQATTFNASNESNMVTSPDGSYLLEPVYIVSGSAPTVYGTVEGLLRVTGYNNTAENIITVNGVNYMVFPDGNRATYADFCALRMN